MSPTDGPLQALILDYGEVISQPQRQDTLHSMARILGIEFELLRTLYWKFRDDYDLGRLNGTSYWAAVAEAAGKTVSADEIQRLINEDLDTWKTIRPEMIELVREVKARGLKTAILSNMQPDFYAYLKRDCEWMNLFDVHIFSCEFGVIKPEMEIYQLAIRKLGTEPSRTLFVDDRQVNVDGALRAGLKSIVFTSVEDLRRALA